MSGMMFNWLGRMLASIVTSGASRLNEDEIAERDARLQTRDDREYPECVREEQRSQTGSPARDAVLDQWRHTSSTGAAPTGLPSTERLGDALDRGATVRALESSDLSADFQAKLLDVCRGDPNVAGLWLAWMLPRGTAPELLASMRLDQPDERAIRNFIAHADALGGPRFVVSIAKGVPTAPPFYRRADETRKGVTAG